MVDEHEHDHDHDHVDVETGLEQTVAELEFLRSACAAAQNGETDKLRRMLQGSRSQVCMPARNATGSQLIPVL